MKKLTFSGPDCSEIIIMEGTCTVCGEEKFVAEIETWTDMCGDCAQQIALELSKPEYNDNKNETKS